jgi:beta-glucosidase
LVHVNFDTQKRTIKKSGNFYSEVIGAGGVTGEIYDEYVRNQEYRY